MMLALLRTQGTPFSDHKWRGCLMWIGSAILSGLHTFLGMCRMSKKRCNCIIACIEGIEGSDCLVDVRKFHELATGYTWLSVAHRGAVLSLRKLVKCTLRFIVRRLKVVPLLKIPSQISHPTFQVNTCIKFHSLLNSLTAGSTQTPTDCFAKSGWRQSRMGTSDLVRGALVCL